MFAEFGSGNLPLVYAIGMLLSAVAVVVLLAYDALSKSATQRLGGGENSHD